MKQSYLEFKAHDFAAELQRPYALHGTAAGSVIGEEVAKLANTLLEQRLPVLAEELFKKIEHGDEEYRVWLHKELQDFFNITR